MTNIDLEAIRARDAVYSGACESPSAYRDRRALLAYVDELLAERALLVTRAENAEVALEQSEHNGDIWCERASKAEAALVEAEQEYQDARIVRKQLEARLAETERHRTNAYGDLLDAKARLAEALKRIEELEKERG